MIRADGEGGFEARAFASVPTLLRRASAIARAAARLRLPRSRRRSPPTAAARDARVRRVHGAQTQTRATRRRKPRGGGEPQTSGEADAGRRGRRGLDSEDDATESAETTELALKSVAVMDVNPSLADALGAARGDGDGYEDGDGDEERGRSSPGDADDARGYDGDGDGAPGTLVGENARRFGFRRRASNPRGVRPLAGVIRRSRACWTRWFADGRLRRRASRRVLSALRLRNPARRPARRTVSHRRAPPRRERRRHGTRGGSRRRARRARGGDERRARRRERRTRDGDGRNRRRGAGAGGRGRSRRSRDQSEPKQERRVALARDPRRGPAHGLGRRRARTAGARAARTTRTTRETTHDHGAETRAGEETHREHHPPPPPDERRRRGRRRRGRGGVGSRAGGANVGSRARAVRRRAGWAVRRGEVAWSRASRRSALGRRAGARMRDARGCAPTATSSSRPSQG